MSPVESIGKGIIGGIMGYVEDIMLEAIFKVFQNIPQLSAYLVYLSLYSIAGFLATVIGSMELGFFYIIGLIIGGIILGSPNIILTALCSLIGLGVGIRLKSRR